MAFFKGLYFRHQNENETVAFIAGTADDGAFVQVITDGFSRIFSFPDAKFGETIEIGNNRFSLQGITIDLPGIKGTLTYRDLSPLASDIMGPFRFLPMQCRHQVLSMHHRVEGSLTIDGKVHDFDGGVGYIEGDAGRSFPKSYLWVAANDFAGGESFLLSVADIPFCAFAFQGVICALMVGGREYRLATYRGGRATVVGDTITIRQGRLTLRCTVMPRGDGFPLTAPKGGKMQIPVREHNDATLHVTLHHREKLLCDLISHRAGYERVNM